MRRILLVMVLLLLSSCHLKQDETFVNPVFYGKMESLNDLWDVTITPFKNHLKPNGKSFSAE